MHSRNRTSRALSFATLAFAIILASGCGQVSEFIVVDFKPDGNFKSAGRCPQDQVGDTLQPTDIAVLIEGECHGMVGDTIPLTRGSFEISVDVVSAEMQVVQLEGSTYEDPLRVTIQVSKRP